MIRLWFKDGTYMDIELSQYQYWEMDPGLERVEYLNLTQAEIDSL